MSSIAYTLRIPIDLVERLDALAESKGWSRAKVVIDLCQTGIRNSGIEKVELPEPLRSNVSRPVITKTEASYSQQDSEGVHQIPGTRAHLPDSIPGVTVAKKLPIPQRPVRQKPDSQPSAWCPTSKCQHGYMNSFICERSNGGCKR
jgi:hypothetical protein